MKTSFALIRRRVCIRARKLITFPSISAIQGKHSIQESGTTRVFAWARKPNMSNEARLTFEIQLLEKKPVFMIPPLAHIHTVWPVQFRKIWGSLTQELLVFNSRQRLTFSRLDLCTFLVHTSPLLLCGNGFSTLTS